MLHQERYDVDLFSTPFPIEEQSHKAKIILSYLDKFQVRFFSPMLPALYFSYISCDNCTKQFLILTFLHFFSLSIVCSVFAVCRFIFNITTILEMYAFI